MLRLINKFIYNIKSTDWIKKIFNWSWNKIYTFDRFVKRTRRSIDYLKETIQRFWYSVDYAYNILCNAYDLLGKTQSPLIQAWETLMLLKPNHTIIKESDKTAKELDKSNAMESIKTPKELKATEIPKVQRPTEDVKITRKVQVAAREAVKKLPET